MTPQNCFENDQNDQNDVKKANSDAVPIVVGQQNMKPGKVFAKCAKKDLCTILQRLFASTKPQVIVLGKTELT